MTPSIVQKIILIKETNKVFKSPTKKARAYESDPLYSIKENWTSIDYSWDKNPKPKSIPLLSMLVWALIVKNPKIRTTKSMAKIWGKNFFIMLFIRVYIKKRARYF